jgi:hypothetical protein
MLRRESVYCQNKPDFFDGDCEEIAISVGKESSLDMELKLLANDHFLCKQVREFAER